MKTTLDRFGRIVVPKDIRDQLGLRAGVEFYIEDKDNEIVLKTVERESTLKLKKGILVFAGKMTRDLNGAVRTHREERLRKVAFGIKSR